MKMKRNSIKANKKSVKRRPVKAAESYGWEVDSSEAWEAYEFACDYFGKENLDDQIVSGLSTDELAESLVYIFRMNDFREWDERNGGSDDEDEEYDEDEDIEESRKLRGRKAIKSNRRINKRRPVKAAESISGDMFEQVFAESMSNLNDIFKGNMTFDATVGSVYGASHDKIYPGDGVDFLYNLRDLAEANEGQNIMDYISSYLSDPLYLAVIDDTIDSYIGEHISGEDMNNIDPTVYPEFIDEWYDMFYADCDKLATQVAGDICRYLTSFAMSVEDIDAEMLNHPDEDDMIEDDFLIWRINK